MSHTSRSEVVENSSIEKNRTFLKNKGTSWNGLIYNNIYLISKNVNTLLKDNLVLTLFWRELILRERLFEYFRVSKSASLKPVYTFKTCLHSSKLLNFPARVVQILLIKWNCLYYLHSHKFHSFRISKWSNTRALKKKSSTKLFGKTKAKNDNQIKWNTI